MQAWDGLGLKAPIDFGVGDAVEEEREEREEGEEGRGENCVRGVRKGC